MKTNPDIATKKQLIKSADMIKLSRYRQELSSNPRLTYLFLELTDRCNLACKHCGSNCRAGAGTDLDTGLIISTLGTVVEDFDPQTVMICLTGGEPLLHKDFFKIVEEIVKLGFPWGITSNGTLMDHDKALTMKALGLRSITISLDGLEQSHDWFRNALGSFQKTLEKIRICQDAGISVQITSVIHHKNINELDQLYALMCDLNVVSWRVINMEPIGRALKNEELSLSPKEMSFLYTLTSEGKRP